MTAHSGDTAVRPLHHRFAAPGVPRGCIERPRLDRLLSELLDTYSIVELIAAPGSGKTVQAQLYAASCGRKLAWLTMDRSDSSAASLIFDLATALGDLAGNAISDMRRTLQTSGSTEEAAAILANATGTQNSLLVIDECQQIASSADAASALDTFLEYIPERLQVLLLARQELPWPLQKRYVHGQIAQISDVILNLTYEETKRYLKHHGFAAESCERVFASTGGWVAGVAFASRFGVDEQPNLRNLDAYFGRQVLDTLPDAEQQFLIDTSVAAAVTQDVALALCGSEGQQLWSAVSARHLPATSTTPTTIVCHSLFRSFLRQRLIETDPERYAGLLASYAQHLAASRHDEEATEIWLSLGRLDEAQQTAIMALPALYSRTDWPVIRRWLDAFGEERVSANPALTSARIRTVHGMREFECARLMIRKLDREGRLRVVIEEDQSLLATVAWALQAHPYEALRLLDKYEGDTRANVVRYMIEVTTATRPITPPDSPGLVPADVERQMSWGLFLQGRLGELAIMNPADDDSPVVNPNVILAAAFRDGGEAACRLWRRVPQEIRERAQSRFIEAMVDLSCGDHGRARGHLQLALAECRSTGFSLLPVYEIFMGYLQLQDDGPSVAINRLEPVLDGVARAGQTAYVEMAQCFLGLAYLRAGRTDDAQLILREAVASMSHCHRQLLLPMAAAGLSEADARAGNDNAAAEDAALAYGVAKRGGTLAILISAVRLFPEIQQREMARNPRDTRWRRLVITPSARPYLAAAAQKTDGITLTLQPFGRNRDVLVDGVPAAVGRMKILELVAYLALHPGGVDRFQLQHRLFPEADQRSGGNHFRQIAHKLRHEVDITLERRDNLVLFPPSVSIVANDIESERLLAAASLGTGPERTQRLADGLDLVDGRYLEGSTLPWVEERRNHLELVQEEARLELATICLEQGDLDAARLACEAVLAVNQYCDPAYRVLFEIERKAGSESSALAVYRRAAKALDELGLRPGDARRLMRGGPDGLWRSALPGAGTDGQLAGSQPLLPEPISS
jgi:LuxR family maltose regulon positive regulatory protein